MGIVTLAVGPLQANCYVVVDPAAGEAAVIDAGDEPERILAAIGPGVRVTHLLNTHAHFDHVGAVAAVREKTGARFWLHPQDRTLLSYAPDAAELFAGHRVPPPPDPDGHLAHGQEIRVGGIVLTVRHTPGHSPGSVSFVLAGEEPAVFTGDALFAGSIGRTDLPGGRRDELLRSIREQLLTLDDACRVYPGHGPVTTIGAERRHNPFLA